MKASTRTSGLVSIDSDRGPDAIAARAALAHRASSSPAMPPAEARSSDSASACRTTRMRPAPMARHTAVSRRRASARASIRFATFAHAMIEHEPDQPHQDHERRRKLAAQPRRPGRGVGDHQPALEHALPELRALRPARHLFAHPVVARLEQRARLRAGDVGAKTRDETQPGRAVALPEPLRRVRLRRHRQPHVRRFTAGLPKEAPSGDADDGERLPAQPKRAADDRRVVREPARPVRVIQHRHPVAGRQPVVGRQNRAADRRRAPPAS